MFALHHLVGNVFERLFAPAFRQTLPGTFALPFFGCRQGFEIVRQNYDGIELVHALMRYYPSLKFGRSYIKSFHLRLV